MTVFIKIKTGNVNNIDFGLCFARTHYRLAADSAIDHTTVLQPAPPPPLHTPTLAASLVVIQAPPQSHLLHKDSLQCSAFLAYPHGNLETFSQIKKTGDTKHVLLTQNTALQYLFVLHNCMVVFFYLDLRKLGQRNFNKQASLNVEYRKQSDRSLISDNTPKQHPMPSFELILRYC